MKRRVSLLFAVPICAAAALAQSYQQGKILKWAIEPRTHIEGTTYNQLIYYIQIDNTVYQITRKGPTLHGLKPDANLSSGKAVQCRIDKDQMLIPNEKGKQVKYLIIGEEESK
jgi:hypothetical protein